MNKKPSKPKIKVNALKSNPLFINFLNWKGDKFFIERVLTNLVLSLEQQKDKEIVLEKIHSIEDSFLNDLTLFQKYFKKFIKESINTKTVSHEFLFFLNNAYKYISEDITTYANDVMHKVTIIDPKGKWLQAIISYNFILTFNYFGLEIVKQCPICASYFCHKGKYAKYCSEGCKEIGMNKK